MKKSTLKLKLNRETLRNLEQPELGDVAGAATLAGVTCDSSCYVGCNSRHTCGSVYC
jgi:hypothetical protein